MILRTKEILYQLYWQFVRISWNFVPFKQSTVQQFQYSIGITTYVDRYEHLFKPFFLQLIKLFPDTQLIISSNGHFDTARQKQYMEDMKNFLQPYHNVKLVAYAKPQSLSKLWNQLVLNSQSPRVIICNEDLEISPRFRHELEHSAILNSPIALINKSWSHFVITKEIIKAIGWFDERFPTIGNEDEDYESRLAIAGQEMQFFHFRGIRPIVTIPETYSYGENVDIINKKYLKSNKEFFDTKWEISAQAKEGFCYVRIIDAYVKMRTGMDTPEFYELN